MTEIKFKAGYNRRGRIWIEKSAFCESCKEDKVCLAVDSSEDEYGPGFICAECIDLLFLQNRDKN